MSEPSPVLPNDRTHPHHPLYRHLLEGVQAAQPGLSAQQRANLAAGLTDAYLQSLPEAQRGLRLDQATVRDLRVVPGEPGAATPSLFVVSGSAADAHRRDPSQPRPDRIGTPLATAEVAASRTLAGYAHTRSIGVDGYLTDPGISRTAIAQLERTAMPEVNGIVLHRTTGATANVTLDDWRRQQSPLGTHFLIDRDGTIHQTASLNNHTNHVGKIRSREEEEGTITPAHQRELDAARARGRTLSEDNTLVHRIESAHAYPQRYPTNNDSIGIEVVGTYDARTRTWQAPTEQQLASIQRLVGTLQRNYGLDDRDVYQHQDISYKTAGEGDGLYRPAARTVDDPGVQQPGGPAR